jgi:hypothetical protein
MRYQEIKSLLENQELDEVRMGSSDLQKFLQTPLAQNMKAGFEAELIFSGGNESRDDYEPDYEPDYSADERVNNIDDIINASLFYIKFFDTLIKQQNAFAIMAIHREKLLTKLTKTPLSS